MNLPVNPEPYTLIESLWIPLKGPLKEPPKQPFEDPAFELCLERISSPAVPVEAPKPLKGFWLRAQGLGFGG